VSQVTASCARTDAGWRCDVEVRDGGSATRHSVTVSRAELERFGGSGASPEELVARSFEFLLAREPKESILRAFELSVIERYFPDFPDAMRTEPEP
jgi:hypothetical protein